MARRFSKLTLTAAIGVAPFVWVVNNWIAVWPRELLGQLAYSLAGGNLAIYGPLDIGFDIIAYGCFLVLVATGYFLGTKTEGDASSGALLGVVCWAAQRILDVLIKMIWPYYGFYWDFPGLFIQLGVFAAVGWVYAKRVAIR